MDTKRENTNFGSDLKLLLNVGVEDVAMNTVNFKAVFTIGTKSLTLKKENLIRIDDEHYLACIKAKNTTKGNVSVKVYLDIPDADFEDNIYTIVKVIETKINIV